jgi:uncharacterized protein YbbC (DUF1343 family)
VHLGIDNVVLSRFKTFRKIRIGLCANFSSCDSFLRPTISLFAHEKSIKLRAIFAPEHGLYSALQDQVTAPDSYDKKLKIPIYSLYNASISAEKAIEKQIDCLVIDLVDIGTRYYTFLWSAVLMIELMGRLGKKVFVLDRPNPLGGTAVQGPLLDIEFISFVGLYPIVIRHGMTIGELCSMINQEMEFGADLEVIPMKGWSRTWSFPSTEQPWTMPSPNMPSYETARVYPGMCLLEGTNLSEGRGTTRPFEIFGAPWIDADLLNDMLQKKGLPGAVFRPVHFIPTFHKYKGVRCNGSYVYVTREKVFDPITTGLEIITAIRYLYLKHFEWRKPPYEFEKKRMPFDILIGNAWVRDAIENNDTVAAIKKKWQGGLKQFKNRRKKYLLYE